MLYNYQTGNPNQLWNPLWGRAMGPGGEPTPNIRGMNPTITPVGGVPENVLQNPEDYRFNPGPNRFGSGPGDANMWANLTEGKSPGDISNMWGELTSPWQMTRSIQSGGYNFPAITYPTPGTNTTSGPVSGGATNWTPQYGGTPNVANPLLGEVGALTGNMLNFPLISSLAGEINPLQQGQLLANYEQAFPGFGANMAAGSAGIAHDIAGTVDPSEYAQMAIGAAGRGLAMGQPGASPMTNAAYLSAIGQTAAQRRALGQTELNQRIAATPVVQPYDVTREFVTGQQLTDAANMANMYAAAPVPTAQAAEEQRMADIGMQRGIAAQDWLAERNFGRSQEEQALNFKRQLQSMLLGGQISERQADLAWQRAMSYLQASKTPNQYRGYRGAGIPYSYRGPRFGGSMYFGGDTEPTRSIQSPAAVPTPLGGGTIPNNQSPYRYDPITEQYYGYTGRGAAGNPINPQYFGYPDQNLNPSFSGLTGGGYSWGGPGEMPSWLGSSAVPVNPDYPWLVRGDLSNPEDYGD